MELFWGVNNFEPYRYDHHWWWWKCGGSGGGTGDNVHHLAFIPWLGEDVPFDHVFQWQLSQPAMHISDDRFNHVVVGMVRISFSKKTGAIWSKALATVGLDFEQVFRGSCLHLTMGRPLSTI